MATIVIGAEGPQAEQALALAAAFFKAEFGIEAERQVIAANDDEKILEHIDPNWVAAILSIPGAILATIELNQRLKLIERANTMLSEMRCLLGASGAIIRIGARKTFDIATARAKDIIDAILDEKDDEG